MGGGGWVEGRRAAGGRASERAKRVSEPTVGMLSDMIISATGKASERAKGSKREPHPVVCCQPVMVALAHSEGERSEPDANERAQRVGEPPCLG